MADAWAALQAVIYWVCWPGLVVASAFTIYRATFFYRSLRHTSPGVLVLLTVIGWVLTLIGVAVLGTLYLRVDPVAAGPVVLPIFVVWAGSLVVSVWVMQRWGREAVKLDAYYGELEHIARMKSGFINHVAHELNTPMTPIRIQLDLLQRGEYGELSERQAAALDRLRRNLVRLGRLVDQVVLASFIQSGRLRLHHDPVVGAEIVRAAVSGAKGMMQEPPEVLVHGGEGVEIEADVTQLGYAIQQLLHYALRHDMGAAPVTVDIRGDDHRMSIEVAYQGDLAGDRLYRLFTDPLFLPGQEDEGFGLELFIAHGIIGLHDGDLHIREEGPEIHFVVELPLRARRPRHGQTRVHVETAGAPVA